MKKTVFLILALCVALFAPVCAAYAASDESTSPGGGAEAAAGDTELVAGDAALAPGAYLVVAHPYYKHPVTGAMEDSGQNPGIGQGMTESVLGKEALLEVYDDGSVYVTVRFSLMDNIEDIRLSAQEDAQSAYVPVEFTIVKESMGEGADAQADIRFGLPSAGAIVRAEFYVIAMGREVIFFMDFSDPVAGEGDFITSPAPDPDAPLVGGGVLDAPSPDPDDALVTGADTDSGANAEANAGADSGSEEATTAGAESASADTGADEAAAASSGDGKIDVKLFIVIAAVIVAAAVVCGVVLTRGKSKRDA
ncbi:MAG: hypothetical protein LBJ91_08020 [Clostridiales Family XIII bacterium]|jgi:hypothetical protein|nr:hypothetical protein [Clostridiales Family XIII bacterium]